jgi:hypothetical protein
MPKVLKELAMALGGVALGVALLLLTSSHLNYYHPTMDGTIAGWGYPLTWHYIGLGTIFKGPTVLGVYFVGEPNWLAFCEDLAFWLALAMTAMELSFRFAAPYLWRELKIHSSRKSGAAFSTTHPIQTSDAAV